MPNKSQIENASAPAEKSAHTPGPWTLGLTDWDYTGQAIIGSGGKLVAFTETDAVAKETPEENANARLIVAAPELLEALLFIVNDAEPGEDAQLTVDGYNRACAAIAKAEGSNQNA